MNTIIAANLPRPDKLADHLRMMGRFPGREGPPPGYAFASIYDYVATKGHAAEAIALTDEEREWFDHATKGRRYAVKQCFANSQRFLLGEAEDLPAEWTLVYVEGYVMPDWIPMPIHHGWLELNGKVIDLTLRYHDRKPRTQDRFSDRAIGLFPGREYHGVTFATSLVREHVLKYREWGTLLDN